MNAYKVKVTDETEEEAPRIYTIEASTEDDACQLAFVLDGGWNMDVKDATGMLPLAKTYAEILHAAEKKEEGK